MRAWTYHAAVAPSICRVVVGWLLKVPFVLALDRHAHWHRAHHRDARAIMIMFHHAPTIIYAPGPGAILRAGYWRSQPEVPVPLERVRATGCIDACTLARTSVRRAAATSRSPAARCSSPRTRAGRLSTGTTSTRSLRLSRSRRAIRVGIFSALARQTLAPRRAAVGIVGARVLAAYTATE